MLTQFKQDINTIPIYVAALLASSKGNYIVMLNHMAVINLGVHIYRVNWKVACALFCFVSFDKM